MSNLRRRDPSEGMRLTNGEVVAEHEIYLGVNANEDDWYEITEAEYLEILEKQDPMAEFPPELMGGPSEEEIPSQELKQMIEEVL